MEAKRISQSVGLPVVDIRSVIDESQDPYFAAGQIGAACLDFGFFYVSGHGVDKNLQARLEAASRKFFALPEKNKMEIAMEKAGSAWRGFFPVGSELTSGVPDLKEGLYFGEELSPDAPEVIAGIPLHGANLFPSQIPELRNLVLEYLEQMTRLGHALMAAISLSLGHPRNYFFDKYTHDPFVLFRIFNYPPDSTNAKRWGVGEHTDYGILTILKQDEIGGLEIRSKREWVSAPPIPQTFVCNIGDMLERMTKGRYRSTPHRVKNNASCARLSFPFFFDPGFSVTVENLKYGDYLLSKVAKVFPELHQSLR